MKYIYIVTKIQLPTSKGVSFRVPSSRGNQLTEEKTICILNPMNIPGSLQQWYRIVPIQHGNYYPVPSNDPSTTRTWTFIAHFSCSYGSNGYPPRASLYNFHTKTERTFPKGQANV